MSLATSGRRFLGSLRSPRYLLPSVARPSGHEEKEKGEGRGVERIIENRVTDDQGQTETFLRSPVTRVSRSYLAHATRSVIPPSFRSLVGSRYLGSPPHPFVRSSFTSFTRPLRSSVTSGPPSLRSVGTTEGSGERLGGKEDDRSEAERSDTRRLLRRFSVLSVPFTPHSSLPPPYPLSFGTGSALRSTGRT